MGFRIVPRPTFSIKVRLHVPGFDEPAEIEVEYKYLNPEQLNDFKQRHGENPISEPLKELIVSWHGPEDDKGQPVPYSVSALAQLLTENHIAGEELLKTYYLEVYGARRKN